MAAADQYDLLAARYAGVEELPVRVYAECPLLLAELAPLAGKDVLDLACGTGLYTRLAKQAGAARVVGADISAEQIAQARRLTPPELGVDYRVLDAGESFTLGEFDAVIAAFLLNYAPDLAALHAMAEQIAGHLRPGGRFVGALPRLDHDRGLPQDPRLGVIYGSPPDPVEGQEFDVTLYPPQGDPMVLRQRWWTRNSYRTALESAGLTEVRFQPWLPTEAGIAALGEEYWAGWVANPLGQLVTARRAR